MAIDRGFLQMLILRFAVESLYSDLNSKVISAAVFYISFDTGRCRYRYRKTKIQYTIVKIKLFNFMTRLKKEIN